MTHLENCPNKVEGHVFISSPTSVWPGAFSGCATQILHRRAGPKGLVYTILILVETDKPSEQASLYQAPIHESQSRPMKLLARQ